MSALFSLSTLLPLVVLGVGVKPAVLAETSPQDLTLWFRADRGVTTAEGSANVISWSDHVSPGSILLGSDRPIQQPQLLSGGPAGALYVRMDGATPFTDSDYMLQGPDRSRPALFGGNSTASTVIGVLRASGQSTPLGFPDGGGHAPLSLHLQQSSGLIIFSHGDPGTGSRGTLWATAPGFFGAWHVLTVQRTGGGGQIRVDGVPIELHPDNNSFDTSIDFNLAAGIYTGISLGGPGGNGQAGDLLDLAEIRHYNRSLTPTELTQLEQSLGSLYQIAVVPEPSVASLLATGSFAIWALRRKRS